MILYSVVWIRGDNVSVYTAVLGVSYEELSLPGPYLLRSVIQTVTQGQGGLWSTGLSVSSFPSYSFLITQALKSFSQGHDFLQYDDASGVCLSSS